MDHKQWLEGEISKAARTARSQGLGGNRYSCELFTTEGKIYDGSISVGDLSTKQQMETAYPSFQSPAIIRLNDGHHTFEVGIAKRPEGVIVKITGERLAAAAV